MKRILRFLMLTVLFLPFALQAQNTVTIGDLSSSTNNSFLPMNSLYDYSYSQQIYESNEIGVAGTITSITMWLYGNSQLYAMPFNIYMLEVTDNEFATTSSWIPVTASDIVYSGSVTVHNTTDSAYTFNLDIPFVYSGTGNLLICFDNNTGQWKSGLNGMVFAADDNISRAIYARRDNTDYDPTNMSGITATSITTSRNVITFEIIPSGGQICEKPSTLVISDITAHEASFSWNSTVAGNYQFEYKTAADTIWTEISLTDTFYTLSGLTQNTTYNARVKSICGIDFESGYKSTNFTTLISCPAPTGLSAILTPGDGTIATLNWNENGTATAWQICLNGDETNLIDVTDITYDFTNLTPDTAYTVKVRAICDIDDQSTWSNTITFTPTDAYSITVNDGTTTNGYVPIYGYWCDNITKSQFIIPAANLTAMQFGIINKLTFYASQSSVSWGVAEFDVYLTETTETTLSALADYTSMTQVYAGTLSITNNTMEVIFTNPYLYMGGNLLIGFMQTESGTYSSSSWYGVSATGASMGGYGTNISQQNFLPKTTIDYIPGDAPDCLPVSNLTVTNITSSTVTLNWSSDANSYSVYDMSDTTLIMSGITDNSYTITDLNPNTNYLFGVQANCTGSDAITVYVSARTTCAPLALPFTEDFSSSVTNDPCWAGASGVTASEIFAGDTLNLSSPGWTYTSTVRDGLPAEHYYVNIYGTSCNKWIITPEIDLTDATSPLLSFDAAFTKWNQAIPAEGDIADDIFMVIVSTDGGLTWDSLNATTISLTSLIGTTYIPQYIDLSSHIGNAIRIAFYAESTVTGGDNDLHIDNITVAESTGAICYPISDLAVDNVTATSVFLSWSDANNDDATYTIYNMADTSVVATNVNDLEYEVSGLTASTAYTFGVVANCSPTDASIIRTVNTFTDCANGSCQITITGTDSYGDGWNGASISVMQSGVLVGSFTVTSSSTTTSFSVCSGIPVSFVWNTGSYDDECDFIIYDGGSSTVFTANGEDVTGTFFTLTNACPSCLPANNLTVDATTETSITISWTGTAASYDVYEGENFVANVTTTTYTFTGLTPATGYVFGVQAICSADDSASVATINAMTECVDITSLPYNEGFENDLGCWNTINGSSDGQPWFTYNCAALSSVEPHSGSYVASSWSWNSSAMHANAWLISPKFILPTTNDALTFSWWDITNSSYPDRYSVVLSTTTNDTAAFTTTVYPYTAATGDWTIHTIDLTSYAGQSIYIAFHHVDYDANYLLIDDISLFEGGYVPPAPDTLTVTFAVNNATMGTTNPVPGTYQYITGDTVRFTAIPNTGYRFAGWEWVIPGTGVDTLGTNYISAYFPANAMMQYGSMTLTALFEVGNPDSTTITYAVNDATMGTISPAPGTYTIYVGGSIDATATPNTGYVLSAWMFDIYLNGSLYDSDTILSSDADFSNPMHFGTLPQSFADYNATITITAVFAPASVNTYTVTVNVNNSSMGTATGGGTFNDGSQATVSATANAGYHFVAWMNGTTQVSTANPYTFTVNSNITLTATFEADPVTQYTVTLNTADATMGTVNPAGASTVNEGSSFTATATAADGFHFVAWMNGTTQVSTANPYTFTVTGNITLTATFEANDPGITYYEVTVTSADPNMGNVSSTASGSVAENTEVTVTATPAANYHFVNWIDRDGNVVSEANPYTFTVTADIALIATFAPNVGINDIDASNVMIYANNSTIYVRGAESHNIFVYDMNGRCIYQNANANETETISMSCAGIYLVRIDNAIFKKVVIVR